MEQYTTLGSSTLASGYTSGSGSLVVSSAASFPSGPSFRVAWLSGGVVTLIWKVTAVAGTTFTVTVEYGTDQNVSSGQTIQEVLTADALDQIRLDIGGAGTYANLPSSPKNGDQYLATDSPYALVRSGGVWIASARNERAYPPSAVGSWSTFDQSSASPAVAVDTASGVAVLTAGFQSSNNWVGAVHSIPSAPYTCDVLLSQCVLTSGLCLRNSSSKKVIMFRFDSGSSGQVLIDKWNNSGVPASYDGGYNSVGALGTVPGLFWMRIADDNTNRSFWLSPDGKNFTKLYSGSRTDYITPDQIGFACFNNSTSWVSGQAVVLACLSWHEY